MTRGHDKGLSFLFPKASQRKQELGVGTYDAENTKKELANAIIMHDYPLSIMVHVGFRRYSATLQSLFHVPSRNTIKKRYSKFIYVPAPHTSDIISYPLVECFMDWNIDTKISTITLDNCSTNDVVIPKIKDKLRLGNLLRDGSLLHMRCCAHILNLIVKDGLEVVKDEIEKIRDSVAYWNATPKRNEKFEETPKQLRTNGIVYPTLQAIAKDLLAIHISTVASESTFSTSGRILSPHRRNLNLSLTQEYATVLNEMESDDEVKNVVVSFVLAKFADAFRLKLLKLLSDRTGVLDRGMMHELKL
ncbi:hypothetical protein Lal_00018993 [Lupinus albus]|nr:hypothetical protein Lal_00018993 [Lupinus albus]